MQRRKRQIRSQSDNGRATPPTSHGPLSACMGGPRSSTVEYDQSKDDILIYILEYKFKEIITIV